MTRQVVRLALLALIGFVVLAAAWPKIASVVKVDLNPNSTSHTVIYLGTCEENKVDGVGLIVEYASTIYKACGWPEGKTGWAILNEFGAHPKGTVQYPAGFVCTLFDYPKNQDCQDTPNASEGTWNYFYATASEGDRWIYAVTGAGIRKPKCGDVEAWVFEVPTSNQSALPPQTKAKPQTCK